MLELKTKYMKEFSYSTFLSFILKSGDLEWKTERKKKSNHGFSQVHIWMIYLTIPHHRADRVLLICLERSFLQMSLLDWS